MSFNDVVNNGDDNGELMRVMQLNSTMRACMPSNYDLSVIAPAAALRAVLATPIHTERCHRIR